TSGKKRSRDAPACNTSPSLNTPFGLQRSELGDGWLYALQNAAYVLTLPRLIGLGVQERHIQGSMAGGLLRFHGGCAHLLAPCHIQTPEGMHSEACEIDSRGFRGRPEYMLLQIPVIQQAAILPLEDEIRRRAVGGVPKKLVGKGSDLADAPRGFAPGP